MTSPRTRRRLVTPLLLALATSGLLVGTGGAAEAQVVYVRQFSTSAQCYSVQTELKKAGYRINRTCYRWNTGPLSQKPWALTYTFV